MTMIAKIEKIASIGKFRDYTAKGDVSFKECTLLYADNGSGKTTLAAIIRSLLLNDEQIIRNRLSDDSTADQAVILTTKDHTGAKVIISFGKTGWKKTYDNVEIFDTVFVNENIYSGFDISDSHKKNLHEFVVGSHGVLIKNKIAMDAKIIKLEEREVIQFAHEIRNGVYHRWEEDKLKLDLALLVYFGFVTSRFKEWGSPSGLTGFTDLPEYKPINFGQVMPENEFLFDGEKYFASAFDTIIAKWQISENLAVKAHKAVVDQIRQIERGLEFIKTDGLQLNYYGALSRYWYLNDQFSEYKLNGRKPSGIDRILLLSLYIWRNEDYLADIPELENRQRAGRRLLGKLGQEYRGKYPFWADLEKIKQRADEFRSKSTHVIIKNLIDIQNKISNLYLDVEEAASNPGSHIQHLLDISRGK